MTSRHQDEEEDQALSTLERRRPAGPCGAGSGRPSAETAEEQFRHRRDGDRIVAGEEGDEDASVKLQPAISEALAFRRPPPLEIAGDPGAGPASAQVAIISFAPPAALAPALRGRCRR